MQGSVVFASWLRTRWLMRRDAGALAAHRAKLWHGLQPALHQTPALAAHAGQPLASFPITDVATIRAGYGAWNSVGLSDAALRSAADAAEAGEGTGAITAGWSTGSGGGARGLFLADGAERADYIGQSLARLLPPTALLQRQRLALHLRASNKLYADAGSGRWAFAHFRLDATIAQTSAALQAFAPTILVAPPGRLVAMARSGVRLPSLRHLFHGSEPMSHAERVLVAAHFGLPPRAIWQATEGFLAAECAHGRLHLNDHALEVELEPVPGATGFRPIITDLRRRTQPIVRVRGDDFLEPDLRPACACGYAGRTILPVMGRVGDLWRLPGGTVTPREVVDLVEGAIGTGHDWQAMASSQGVHLDTDPNCDTIPAGIAAETLERLTGMDVMLTQGFAGWRGPKRRKVIWQHG